MTRNYIWPCLFGISACFLASTVGYEAILNTGYVTRLSVYQVSVQIDGHGHVGGGGIIGDRFVLTAAHCILNRARNLRSKLLYVLAGTSRLNITDPTAVTIRVHKIFFPAEFHPTVAFAHGDIAVLQLADSLQLKHRRYLKKLELPRQYYSWDDGQATIAGYGWDHYRKVDNNEGIGSSDGKLRITLTNVLPNEKCENHYPFGAIQVDRHLCAKARRLPYMQHLNELYGVCNGDSGGPLVLNETIVIGILSRIPSHCDGAYEPGVYTRVIHYVGMILNVMYLGRDPTSVALDL